MHFLIILVSRSSRARCWHICSLRRAHSLSCGQLSSCHGLKWSLLVCASRCSSVILVFLYEDIHHIGWHESIYKNCSKEKNLQSWVLYFRDRKQIVQDCAQWITGSKQLKCMWYKSILKLQRWLPHKLKPVDFHTLEE